MVTRSVINTYAHGILTEWDWKDMASLQFSAWVEAHLWGVCRTGQFVCRTGHVPLEPLSMPSWCLCSIIQDRSELCPREELCLGVKEVRQQKVSENDYGYSAGDGRGQGRVLEKYCRGNVRKGEGWAEGDSGGLCRWLQAQCKLSLTQITRAAQWAA